MNPPARFVTLVGLLLALLGSASAADLAAPAPFQAHYDLYGIDLPLGEASMELHYPKPSHYAMRFNVRPNRLVALLVANQVQEQASGEIRDGEVQPIQYEQQATTSGETRKVYLRFDRSAQRITAQSNGEQAVLPLSSGIMDPLSLNLTVMWDLQRGQLPEQYTLIDRTELRRYQIRHEGEALLKTALGSLRTVRISQAQPGGTRLTTFWFAVDLQYLPVRITRQKKGREDLRLEIRSVEQHRPLN
ncbi:MAG: DUF3108 domain-containing protein [Gammaproteobacteria bacterium]|nr:DUF3108 domain-containing protein [Gammaproteobacteria bacterium]MCP5197977.1 DUF3108 domain-containing protein [Gammaproteobacteria bacterium]